MKMRTKRTMSFILTLLMTLSLFTPMAIAAEKPPIKNDDAIPSPDPSAVPLPEPVMDIRNMNFGMSKEEVRLSETEGTLVDESDTGILYDDITVAGLSSLLICTFNENDELFRVGYVFDEVHTSENAYISDFSDVQEALTEKYGTPTEDNVVWNRDLYKDEPGDYGFAVSIGDLVLQSIWRLENMTIGMMLSGDNYEITMALSYTSTAISELVEDNSGL